MFDPSRYSGRTVLVTGGAGFLGSHLVEALTTAGARVVVLDDLSAGRAANLEAANLEAAKLQVGRQGLAGAGTMPELVVGCVTDAALVSRLVAAADLVFHLAAVVGVPAALRDPLRAMRVNVRGSEAVFEAAAAHRVPVVWTSSSEVYGDGADRSVGADGMTRGFHENDSLQVGPTQDPRGAYACSKALAEWTARALADSVDLQVLTLRLFNVVGPRQAARSGMVLPRFVHQALAGEPLTVYGDGQQTRCFADVRDVVATILALADGRGAGFGTTVNVGADHELRILDLAHLVAEQLGAAGGLRFLPFECAVDERSRDRQRRRPDLGRLRRLLGGDPPSRSLVDTIRAVADTLRAESCRTAGNVAET